MGTGSTTQKSGEAAFRRDVNSRSTHPRQDRPSKLDARRGRYRIRIRQYPNELWDPGIQNCQRLYEDHEPKFQARECLPIFTGRQIAHMINAELNMKEVQGRAVGDSDVLSTEWRIDNLKMFDQALEGDVDGEEKNSKNISCTVLYHRHLKSQHS